MEVLLFSLIPLAFAAAAGVLGLTAGTDSRPGFDERPAGERFGPLR